MEDKASKVLVKNSQDKIELLRNSDRCDKYDYPCGCRLWSNRRYY